VAQLTGKDLWSAGQQRARQARASLPSLRALFLLWIPAALAAGAVLLPILYLILRAAGGDASALDTVLRPQTLETLGRTVWLAFWVTLLSIGIALPLAWLTTRTDLPGRRLWAVLTPLPLVVPSYVGAYLFVSALGPRGLLQSLLEQPFGITRLPEIYGFPGALLVLTLLNYPFLLLSLRAALQRIDPALEEAAASLGLNRWQTFWRVTLPQLRPAVTTGSLLVILYVLRDFGAVAIMRYNTFTRVIYIQYQNSFDRSAAASLALVLICLSLIVLLVEVRARGRARLDSPNRRSRRPTRLPLGRWRWPALVFCAFIVLVSLVMPAGFLVYWLLRGLGAGEALGGLWAAAGNSLLASGLAALAATLAALPISILDVRRNNPASRLLERISYIAFALPGIVIALALVFFGANYAPALYQTLSMLVLAYVILFLPQIVGTVRTSLLQVHPNMEEAGRGLGKSAIEVFARITLPLVRPGIAAGAVLVFLTAMKELPATLLLAPSGFSTLATSVWSSVSEAFFARAAAPALLLVLLSSLPMALLELRQQADDKIAR
jgi:iron(III) transport system permease protein